MASARLSGRSMSLAGPCTFKKRVRDETEVVASAVRRACRYCRSHPSFISISKIDATSGLSGDGLPSEDFTAGKNTAGKNKKPGCPFGIIRALGLIFRSVAVFYLRATWGNSPDDVLPVFHLKPNMPVQMTERDSERLRDMPARTGAAA